jgi:hypothetical protein
LEERQERQRKKKSSKAQKIAEEFTPAAAPKGGRAKKNQVVKGGIDNGCYVALGLIFVDSFLPLN